jgi:hypothetical protein
MFSSAPQRPTWIDHPTVNPGCRDFLGQAVSETLQDATEAARNDAQRVAAEEAGVQVSSVMTEKDSLAKGKTEETVQAQSRSVALAAIHDFRITDSYSEAVPDRKTGKSGYRVWVLAEISDEAFRRAVAEATDNLRILALGRGERLKSLDKSLARAGKLLAAGKTRAADGFEEEAAADWTSASAELDVASAVAEAEAPDRVQEILGLKTKVDALLSSPSAAIGDYKAAVARIAKAVVVEGGATALVRVTYKDLPEGGPAGPVVAKFLEDTLAVRAPGAVVPNKVFLERLGKLEIPVEGVLGELSPENRESLKVRSVLFAQYWDTADGIELSMRLQRVGSGELLAAGNCALPGEEIRGLPDHLKPKNLELANKALNALGLQNGIETDAHGIGVKIWPMRGESCTYALGEKLGFYVLLDRPAFLYLVHVDASGSVQLLLPNPWQAQVRYDSRKTMAFPDAKSGFDFTATKPLGAEVILAVATEKPLECLGGIADGFKELGVVGGKKLGSLMKEISGLKPSERGMDRCVYTTVEEP